VTVGTCCHIACGSARAIGGRNRTLPLPLVSVAVTYLMPGVITAECSTIELPGIISILCQLRSIFKHGLGDIEDMTGNNRRE
jgi:hypothetical protein